MKLREILSSLKTFSFKKLFISNKVSLLLATLLNNANSIYIAATEQVRQSPCVSSHVRAMTNYQRWGGGNDGLCKNGLSNAYNIDSQIILV